MTSENTQFLLFPLLILAVFVASRISIRELFLGLRRVVKGDRTVSLIIALVFFPGTLVHEISHMLMALALMLRVQEIKIFPTVEDREIKLGRVTYVKQDPIRGILVGVAPLLVGLLLLFLLAYFQLFPSSDWLMNILLGYGIFTLTTTMFSSKQDLIDLLYLLPFLVFVVGILFIFNIRIDFIVQNKEALAKLSAGFAKLNLFLFFAVLLNLLCILVLKVLQSLGKK